MYGIEYFQNLDIIERMFNKLGSSGKDGNKMENKLLLLLGGQRPFRDSPNIYQFL